MKKITGIVLLLLPFVSFSQPLTDMIRSSQNGMRAISGPYKGLYIQDISVSSRKSIEEQYMNHHWNVASIMVNDVTDGVLNYPAKYNLKNANIELMAPNGIKVLQTSRVKNMVWTDSISNLKCYFVNGKDYLENGNKMDGLFEVLVDGKVGLLKRISISIQPPDFNPLLNVGSVEEKVVQKPEYFVLKDVAMVKVKNKKDLLNQLDENKDAVKAYMEDQKIDAKKEKDLIQIMTFYNAEAKSGG